MQMDWEHRARVSKENVLQGGRCGTGGSDNGEPYWVLVHSRQDGTRAHLCLGMEDALRTLTRLAAVAERERQADGEQRYFCLTPQPPEPPQPALCEPGGPSRPDAGAIRVVIRLDGLDGGESDCTCGSGGIADLLADHLDTEVRL